MRGRESKEMSVRGAEPGVLFSHFSLAYGHFSKSGNLEARLKAPSHKPTPIAADCQLRNLRHVRSLPADCQDALSETMARFYIRHLRTSLVSFSSRLRKGLTHTYFPIPVQQMWMSGDWGRLYVHRNEVGATGV